MEKNISFELLIDGEHYRKIDTKAGENAVLPRPSIPGKSFLGWHKYKNINHGFMNLCDLEDRVLHAIYTSGPAYIIESHFRGVPLDALDKKCHFRRYVIDIYLEGAKADCGSFRLENCNHIFYYLGNIPEDSVKLNVEAVTNVRGGAYRDEAYFTTSDITVSWTSNAPIDALTERKKLGTLTLAFGKWGTTQAEFERRTSDEIIIPHRAYPATVGEDAASVSANFYGGINILNVNDQKNPAFATATERAELPDFDKGNLITRFAALSDSHVGYKNPYFTNYEWFKKISENLETINKTSPIDFVVQIGDNIDDGYEKTYEADYRLYLDVIRDLTICDPENPIENRKCGAVPHYEIQGNHDTSFDTRFKRQRIWYSGNENGDLAAFISFFSSYGGYPAVNFQMAENYKSYRSYGVLSDETVKFIESGILEAKERGAKHIVLLSHFGIASDLSAPILPESGLGKIENVCNKYGIKLFINGHEHNKNYTLRKYNSMYDYDAAMSYDKYAVYELYEKCAIVTIYNTADSTVNRIDLVDLS